MNIHASRTASSPWDMAKALISKAPNLSISPLRIIGIISAFQFGTTSWLALLEIYRLNKSQHFLIPILELVLSGWAITEASSRAARQTGIPMTKLKLWLWCQVGLSAARLFKELNLIIDNNAQGQTGETYSFIVSLSIQFLLFSAILNQLISAFQFTERKHVNQLEDARIELKNKLRASMQASGVAHEINQPLSTILLNVELMRKEMSNANPQTNLIYQRCSQIASDSKRVVSTIAVMRNLLRTVQTDHTIVNLADVINTALLQERACLASRNTRITISGLDSSPKLLGDAGQLQMALHNLIRNASEAINAASSSIPQIEISLTCSSNQIELQVADNGPGFPEDCLNKLELPTTKPEGSGIGLFLCRLTLENHSGSLILGKSRKLGGAAVTMLLPAINQ